MFNVNFEAMKEKYLEILRHYVNPNDCKTVIEMLLNLHSVSKSFYSDDAIARLKTEYFEKGLKANK